MDETTPIPEQPTLTLTPTPSSTPVGRVVYTLEAPGSETGYEVVFNYSMDAGDVATVTLLACILLVTMFNAIVQFVWRDH